MKPKLVGINHVAIEVGDLEQALAFYGAIFDFTLRGRAPGHAFLDLGDQFLAMTEVATKLEGTPERHFGLVVDDRAAARALIEAAGGSILPGGFLDFLDPWGNRVELVDYKSVQFTKAASILAIMGIAAEKDEKAGAQLRDKGFADN